MNIYKNFNYDMKLLQDHFWKLYLNSNSPSKALYDKEGDNHHLILKLWMDFIQDEDKVKMMFWNNDELNIAPTHFFSKLYEVELANATVFERRCVGYLCSFLMQSRASQEKDRKHLKRIRVADAGFRIKHGQVFV